MLSAGNSRGSAPNPPNRLASDVPPGCTTEQDGRSCRAVTNHKTLSFDEFEKVDIRVGRIVQADEFPQARKPAYKLSIDFGSAMGLKTSSAQLTRHYQPAELVGKLVVAVVNFPPRQIGPFMSQVLTLGVPDESGAVVLLVPERDVPLGGKMF